MIRLNLARTAQWVDLGHGVRVLVAPLTAALLMAAKASVLLLIVPAGVDAPDAWRAGELIKALGRALVREWEGVEGADGLPAPVTPEGVDALLDLPPLAGAFEQRVLQPAWLLSAEKNASSPSPNGISAGAMPIAAPAAPAAPNAPIG